MKHGRLIDADALMPKLKFIQEAEYQIYGKESWGFAGKCIAAVEDAPTIEPECKNGEWIDEGFYADGHGAHAFRCSECGGHIIEYDTDPFCKWCGADMIGKKE
jgi:hypothetical protein